MKIVRIGKTIDGFTKLWSLNTDHVSSRIGVVLETLTLNTRNMYHGTIDPNMIQGGSLLRQNSSFMMGS